MQTKSLEKIGNACNPPVTRQAVFKWVIEGKLVRSKAGKVDIDHPQNREFLAEMGADFSKKPVKKAEKPAPEPKESKVKYANQYDKREAIEQQANPAAPSVDRLYKIERLKMAVTDNKLKELALLEKKNKLFSRETVESVTTETAWRMITIAMDLPAAIVDEILNLRVTHAGQEREALVSLLRSRYMEEYRRILEDAKKKITNLKNRDKDTEENEK